MATSIAKAALTLDSSQYRREINRASDDTKRFANNAKQSNDIASASFDKLKAAIAGVGITALIAKVNSFGNAVQNLGRASELGSNGVLAVQEAFIVAGGSADKARDAISDFTKNMGEAKLGSTELSKAFAKANVSFEDLATLSKQDLFKKTIDGLNQIPDSATRTATAFKLMGESVKGLDLAAMNDQLAKQSSVAAGSTTSIAAAAAANGNLSLHMERLTKALLDVVEPLNNIVSKIDISVETFKTFIKIIGQLTGVWLIFGKGIPLIGRLMDSFVGTIRTAGGGLAFLGNEAGKVWGNLKNFATGLGRTIGVIEGSSSAAVSLAGAFAGLGRAALRLAGWIGIVISAYDLLDYTIKKLTGQDIKGWWDDAAVGLEKWVTEKFPKLAASINSLGEKLGMGGSAIQMKENNAELQRLMNKAAALKKEQEEADKAAAAAAKQLNGELKTMMDSYAALNSQLDESTRNKISELNFNAELIGKTKEEVEERKRLREITKSYTDEISKLNVERAKLSAGSAGGTEAEKKNAQAKINLIDAEIAVLEELSRTQEGNARKAIRNYTMIEGHERINMLTAKLANDLEAERASILGYSQTAVEKFNRAREAGDFRDMYKGEINSLELAAKTRDREIGQYNAIRIGRETEIALIELQTSLTGRQFTETEKLAQLKLQYPEKFKLMTTAENAALEKQAEDLDAATSKLKAYAFARDLLRQGEDFAQSIKDQIALDTAYSEGKKRSVEIEISLNRQLLAKKREIMDAYGDEAKLSDEMRIKRDREIDAAVAGYSKLKAEQIKAATEDQARRDTFAFGWEQAFGQYAAAAENNAKHAQTYFETFSKGVEDAFVKFVQTGKLSFKDLANSLIAEFARIQAQKALSGIMGSLGGGGGGSLFGSIGSFLGGLFRADGGPVSANSPYIVGERGPELFVPGRSGSIVPNNMLGGTGGSGSVTQVTYNIQATDAQSFKQQLARDPSFVHAVVEQGRRSTPAGARR